MKIPNILKGLRPKPHQGSALEPLGGSQRPPTPQLIIAIAAQSFSQNSKKKPDQLIFPYFDHCYGIIRLQPICDNMTESVNAREL